jgi:hypothetical protein
MVTHSETDVSWDRGRPGSRRLVHAPTEGNGKYPVLCFLHGRGEARKGASDARRVKEYCSPPGLAAVPSPPAEAAAAKEKLEKFLVVSLQLPQPGHWNREDARWVWEAVSDASRDKGNGQFFLTGFSWGGGGVLRFAAAQIAKRAADRVDSQWSALWVVDPNPKEAPKELPDGFPVLLHHGRYFEGIGGWKKTSTKLPWEDVDALQRAATKGQAWWTMPGARCAVRPFANLGHTDTCTRAYQDPDAYDWLLGVPPAQPAKPATTAPTGAQPSASAQSATPAGHQTETHPARVSFGRRITTWFRRLRG